MRPGARSIVLACAALLAPAASGASLWVSPDVPTTLGGTSYLPWEAPRHDAGIWTPALSLPPGTAIDGLHRMENGDWLFSVAAPATLDGTTFSPEDVVRHDGASYALYFDAAAAGIPPGANVDALFLLGGDGGDLVLSFEVPVTIGGTTYEPGDLARRAAGTFTPFLDGSSLSPPIPPTTNVTGAAARGGLTLLTLSVPTTLAGTTYLPGDVVAWDGASFSFFHSDPGWPPGSRADAFALLPRPGRLGVTLTMAKSALTPGGLTLSWGASCSAGADDYSIHEGELGDWYGHGAIDCSDDGGDRTEEVVPAPGNRYYLVVPWNAEAEGSYGTGLGERPQGAPSCVAAQTLSACP